MASERQRYQRLAVRLLAKHACILRRDPDRVLALLRQGRVIDDEHRIRAANLPIGLDQQLGFERRFVPNASPDKMMELIVIGCRRPRGHRLNALALTWTDQACNIERAHHPPRLVAQMTQEWREPTLKVFLPVCYPIRRHGFAPQTGRSFRRKSLRFR